MTEQTNDTAETTIFTNFVDIFGKENMIELQLNTDVLESMFDGDDAVITPVYIQAQTTYQARQALVKALVTAATKMGSKRIGELATQELARREAVE